MLARLIPPIAAVAAFMFSVACREEIPVVTPELTHALARVPSEVPRAEKDVAEAVERFYTARQQTLAWSNAATPLERASTALAVLDGAEAHGFDPRDYQHAELVQAHTQLVDADEDGPGRGDQIAEFDVRLTANLLALGRDVAVGRVGSHEVDSLWKSERELPDLVEALQQSSDDPATFLDRVRPQHAEYVALQQALLSLRGQAVAGRPAVPRVSLKIGQWNPAVPVLRQRLAASGYLPAEAVGSSTQYDADVENAVRAFQVAHGVKATGDLNPQTLAALNVPLDVRIKQVEMNLERWRWMPDELGARHFMVNVPYFHLIAREEGRPVLDIRVVVGKRGNETPLFSDEMTHVVFSPYWNVPDSIALQETLPAVARDPGYLSRNNMEIVGRNGRPVNPSSIPWGDHDALRAYSFRQRPGASNALGLVKFMFPNQHNVYIHDTPADALFSRIGRAFSHGCVRVEEPEALAQYVLRDQASWTPEVIHGAMRAGEEQHVKLPAPIPVHIVYFTAWVDENGGLHFQDDVYGYDARQATLQQSPSVASSRAASH